MEDQTSSNLPMKASKEFKMTRAPLETVAITRDGSTHGTVFKRVKDGDTPTPMPCYEGTVMEMQIPPMAMHLAKMMRSLTPQEVWRCFDKMRWSDRETRYVVKSLLRPGLDPKEGIPCTHCGHHQNATKI